MGGSAHPWTYAYDAFGELVSQTDAKSQTTTLAYDAIGRLVHREEASFTSNWIYDGAANGIGQLWKACTRTPTTSNATCDSLASTDYLKTLSYDTKGRPFTLTLTIDGTGYTYQTDYDSATGRVADVVRPSGLQVDNVYTSLGYLSQEKDHTTGTVYWTANIRDQEMHLLQATAGSGVVTTQVFDANTGLVQQIRAGVSDGVANYSYIFDKLGNLTTRSDMLATGGTVTEISCYDKLNRLTQYSQDGSTCTNGADKKVIAYDAIGNITKKSDVSTGGGYHYAGSANAGPHALTSITSCTSNCMLVNGVTNPTFAYDANGNMTSGAGRTITYASFNMASQIVSGTTTLSLAYDSEHFRFKQVLTVSGPSTTTTLYLYAMGQMEEKVTTLTSTTWRDYIQADGKMVAERFNTGGTISVYYFVIDHLGSVAVVTDASSNISEHDVYDAWGKRLNSDWSDDTTCSASSLTTRGFTGHEEMGSVCLINMNARVYEPTIGRFMTADSVVPDPLDLQAFNRYSYVGNNPLSFTDPTGNCRSLFDCIVAFAVFGPLEPLFEYGFHQAPILATLYIATASLACGPAGAACAAVAAAGVQAAEGGSGEAIMQAFVLTLSQGAIANGVGAGIGNNAPGQFIAQGMVGGAFSVLGGGKFASGFLAAGIGSIALPSTGSSFLDFLAHASLGGVGSVLGGGKFANGAVTAAFAYVAQLQLGETTTSEADSHYVTSRQIDQALQDGSKVDAANAAMATERVKAYFAAHPEDLPSDLVGVDFSVVYDHVRGPGYAAAGHDIIWLHAPGENGGQGPFIAAAGISGNVMRLYLGSADSQMDAILFILHEIGHHSSAAVAESVQILNTQGAHANINTPTVESYADQYAHQIFQKMP